jgi:phosphoenolpyruvate carboxylase
VKRTEIEFPPKHAALRDDVHMLGSLVGDVLREQGGIELFELVERDRTLAIARRNGDAAAASELESRVTDRAPALARDLERAFSSWFQSVNLAEQVHRIRRRRAYFQDDAERPQPGGIGDAIAKLKDRGLSREQVIELLDGMQIQPIFMSHPTESTRRTILRKQQRLATLLYDRLNPTLAPNEQRASLGRIRTEITTAWQTEDHPRQRLTVADEREHVLFFLAEILYRVVPGFYEEIAEALTRSFGVETEAVMLPTMLRFGSWVGGDMDGNPDVHAKTLRETLARQQKAIVNAYFLEMQSLGQLLSQSGGRVSISAALQKRIDEYITLIPSARSSAPARHDRMPYRVFCAQVAERLRATYDGVSGAYESVQQFQRDVELIADSLVNNRGRHAGLFAVHRLQRRIATFGFHLATLDIRQHTRVHHRVIAQALDDPEWVALDSRTRHSRLVEMVSRDASPRCEMDPVGKRTLAVFEAMLQCRRRFGPDAIGAYIVNGVQGPDDIVAPLLLAQWAEAFDKRSNALAIDIAPMFDSMEALEGAGAALEAALADRVYRKHLDGRHRRQMVFVGYSESGKQAGVCASRVAAYRAQDAIEAVLTRAGERSILVHARGGSIARGGGRIDTMVTSMPPRTIKGGLRLTEQGEGITQNYGLSPIALRTLERAFGALAMASATSLEVEVQSVERRGLAIATRLAEVSGRLYKSFFADTPAMDAWFRDVTPIDVIERMQIGARPIIREGFAGLAGLRAVPWVFAWTQNRMMLPGWLGAGLGLKTIIDDFGLAEVRTSYRAWPFLRRLLDDIEVMLARSDLDISRHYLGLHAASPNFFEQVLDERRLAVGAILAIKDQQDLLDADRTAQRGLQLRNPYVDPMNLMQVDLLRRWRQSGREDQDLFEALLASVSGIALGLQSTG